MRIELKDLKSNPMRDLSVDPIDKGQVAKLKKSIAQYEFWGGVTGRKTEDGIEVASGWHRVQAAIASGIKQADIFIGDWDDRDMAIIYATENATQRGNTSTAVAGSVATAIRYLLKTLLSQDDEHVVKIFTTSRKGVEILRGQVANGIGLGKEVIERFLKDVPDINVGIINQQLANLKSSGDYARIVGEIQTEISEETDDEEVLEAAEEAAAAAKERDGEKTFDFEGVAEHLKNSHQVDVFRKVVTGDGIKPYLPVSRQKALAKALVEAANEEDRELTGSFIREWIGRKVLGIQAVDRALTREEKEALERKDWENRAREYQEQFSSTIRSALSMLTKLNEHYKDRPKGLTLHRTGAFSQAVENLRKMSKMLDRL